jgi:hypothetical protein
MQERILTLFAIIVLFIGLISLFFSLSLNKDILLQENQEIPDDDLVSFQAFVTNEYATQEGFVLELSRTQRISSYLDYPLNYSIKDKLVLVTGRYEDSWFSIFSLELI